MASGTLLVQRRRGRSLILAHRDELIQQAVAKLHLVDPTLSLGVVQAERDEHTAPIVVASVQTLSRRSRLACLVADFQTIVIDKAHNAPAPTYWQILDYCRAWRADGPLVVGVTATPEHGDHHSLRQVFDRIVYQKTLLEMMQAGYLVDLRAIQVLLQADFDALRTQQGDFVDAELETVLLAANAPAQVLAAFQAHAADRKALVFTPTVAQAYAIAETFRAAGIAAEALDGTTPLATRRAILQRLHTGATHVVESVTATHCLDACTVIAYLRNEAGAEVLKALIERPTTFLAMHVWNLGEVYYDFFRADGLTAAQTAWTNTLALPLLLRRDADDAFVPRVEVIKVEEPISFADAFALALAERLHVPLITTDHHEFDAVERKGHFRFMWLR